MSMQEQVNAMLEGLKTDKATVKEQRHTLIVQLTPEQHNAINAFTDNIGVSKADFVKTVLFLASPQALASFKVSK
jgi:hypothetical protein